MLKYKTYSFGSKNKHLLLFFAGWHFGLITFFPILFLLSRKGFHVIFYEYEDNILSSDIQKTKNNLLFVRDEALKSLDKIKNNYEQISIFGVSLGAVIGLLIANKTPDVKKVILNITGASMSETIWSWDNVFKFLKQSLIKKGITLEILQSEWQEIEPINNIDNLQGKELLIYATKSDEVIPHNQTQILLQALDQKQISYEYHDIKNLWHIPAAGYFLLKSKTYLEFLK
jgi:esterase/lipase